jgi:hypothetical protein
MYVTVADVLLFPSGGAASAPMKQRSVRPSGARALEDVERRVRGDEPLKAQPRALQTVMLGSLQLAGFDTASPRLARTVE